MVASATDRALDIADLLSTRIVEVKQAYDAQLSTRGQLEQQTIAATQEMFRLEGEDRCLHGLQEATKEAK